MKDWRVDVSPSSARIHGIDSGDAMLAHLRERNGDVRLGHLGDDIVVSDQTARLI